MPLHRIPGAMMVTMTRHQHQPDTRSFLAPDGVRIVYDVWNGDGAVHPVPVVLHHGFAADAHTNWVVTGIVGTLIDDGRAVIALDARGHGRSDKPDDPARYGHAVMSRDVSALLDHEALVRVDLVGYSMGGYVAAITAARREPRLRSVVIGGIGSGALTGTGADRSAIAAGLLAPEVSDIADRTARQFRRFADATGGDRRALAAAMRASLSPLADLGSIAVPALVAVGADDPLAVGPAALAEAIPGARLALTPGDHLAAPGQPEYAAAIVEFLRRVDSLDRPT